MKNTALTQKHISLGAKMVPFAGYNMPVSYSGLNDEHATVRNAVGVFDVSHMGEFILKGENALDLIQRVTSNDASVLTDGKAQYSCLPNNDGGIVDDLIVYRIDEKTYMLVVNASNIDKDWDWISKHNTKGVDMKNISEETSLLAIALNKVLNKIILSNGIAPRATSSPLAEIKSSKSSGWSPVIVSNPFIFLKVASVAIIEVATSTLADET